MNNKGADQTAHIGRLVCPFVVYLQQNPDSSDTAYIIWEKTCLQRFANNTGADQTAFAQSDQRLSYSLFGKYHYPHAFLKKRWGYCNRLRPSVRPSVTLSPPKPLDEIQPNLVGGLLT